jgi:chromosome segregation ATPase
MARTTFFRVVLAAAALAFTRRAAADAASEAKLRDALRAATAQVRTLEDERTAWKIREASLEKEVETLRGQVKAAAGAASAAGAAASGKRSDRELAEAKRQLAEQVETGRKLAELVASTQSAARTSTEAGRACEDERAQLAPRLAAASERLAAAEEKNRRLYQVGKDLIDWLAHLGFGSALAAREPFLGLKRVALENVAQDYDDKLLEQRLQPTPGSQATAPPPQAR